MVTPFVPSPGSDRVSRSPPPPPPPPPPSSSSSTNWKPWGRLEAWRGRGPVDALGYRFELVPGTGPIDGVPIAESSLSVHKGGHFCVDPSVNGDVVAVRRRIRDGIHRRGGGGKASKPSVQVGVQHVSCMADVAVFIALSAAIDLSMDACQLFSQKLWKSLTLLQLLEFILIRYHSLTFFKLGFPGDLARRRLRLAHIQMSGDGVHQQVELLLE
ncbi:hypothetical protein GW17_00013041 [Ensete ventricosum]|nr:hypothetical protein GW17_00013041 [Ensete ventricosum]